MYFGIEGVEGPDHLHLQPVVCQGDAPVFGLHHVDTHNQGVGGGQLEAANQLQKDRRRRQSAEHLVEKAHLEITGRRGFVCAAMLQFAAPAFGFIELRAHCGQILGQACVEQLLPQVGEICVHVNRPQVFGREPRPAGSWGYA